MNENATLKELDDAHVMPTYRRDLALVRGEGCRVWDADGREYLDFMAGIAVCNTGHCHPAVVKAIREQAGKLMHASNLFLNEWQPRLAAKISGISLGGKVFFCNSGAEANECLFKLARKWGAAEGRHEIVTMRNSFHGRTLATMTATGQTKYQKGFEPLVPGFVHADFNDIDSVRAAVTDRTVAVLVEAVQGEGGILPATEDFMVALRALCDERRLLMLCDEVQCGVGRTGKWFGWQNYPVRPDAFSMAKGLGGGFPIGAATATPELSDVLQPGNHASTFGGTPLACAASFAALSAIEDEGLLENAVARGEQLRAGLRKVAERRGGVRDVRGVGLMVGLELDVPAAPVAAKLREAGLLCIPTGSSVLRFVPPLVVTEAEVDRAVELVDGAL